jgi:hypothetical protein
MANQNKPKGWNTRQIPTQPRNTVDTPKVDLNSQAFDDLVQSQGVRIKVYRSSYCPRVKSIDGAEHEIDCDLCHGAQFIDRYPIKTWAFLQSQTWDKSHFKEGFYDGNSVMATFMQGIELQYFSLVELCDFTEAFYERRKRQQGQLDVLKYPGKRVHMLIDYSGKEYFEGSDFKLDPNGNILWKANKGPLTSQIYTINYETAIRFRAIKAQHSNRFAQINVPGGTDLVKMNEQWVIQKDYLVEKRDLDGNVIAEDKIRDPDDGDFL